MLYRIRIFSSCIDSEKCKPEFERLYETDQMENYGPDKDIYIVNDDSYTHAIILNTATPVLTIPKENVVGLAFEPTPFLKYMTPMLDSKFVNFAQKHIGKYFIGDSAGLPHPFINKYAFIWHTVTMSKLEPIKDRPMSIALSHKQEAPGHKYRHDLVRAILASDLDIDIYGGGCRCYSQDDPRIKGIFINDEPYERYHFHICIENFSIPEYTSEKYTNTVLWGTTPIYMGAKNTLFPDYTIALSGNLTQDMELLRNILQSPEKHKRSFSQENIRPKLNLLKNLDQLF